jgi:hypothetical protein
VELVVREIWSEWLERTLSVRDGDDYVARRAARDRAYTLLRHEKRLVSHQAALADLDEDDLIDVA